MTTGESAGATGTGDRAVPLYCIPHAGAGTSAFRLWRPEPGVELRPVLLPGREARRREPRVTDRAALLADLTRRLGPLPTGPYALYGHSLGGLVAHTLAQALHDAGAPGPALVAVGACPPPDATAAIADRAEAPDAELVRLLASFGSVPAEVTPGDVWHRTVLPVLRDDLRLARALRATGPRPLAVPLLAVAGDRDPVAGPEVMAGWRAWTTGRFAARTLPGDHFFLRGRDLPRLLGRACRVAGRLAGRAAPIPEPRRTAPMTMALRGEFQ